MATQVGRDTLRILFYGSDRFSLVSLRALLSLHLSVTVVTKRHCPVYQLANGAGLPIQQWPFAVPKGEFDLGVVVSFGHLIPAASISACTHGMVNVHPSLLPRWRGPAPLVHTILAYDEWTGVSLITVAKNRFDTGSIVKQVLLKESPRNLEYAELEQISATTGAELLVEFISDIEGGLVKARPQSEEGATKAPKVRPSMGRLDWRESIVQVDCRRRAIANFEPLTCWYEWRKLRLFLLPLTQRPPDPHIGDVFVQREKGTDAHISDVNSNNTPPCGYVIYHKKRRLLAIRCADGWVWADHVTVEGRKRMTAQEFYAGFLNKSNCKVFTRVPLVKTDTNSENYPIRCR